ncbi:MAG: ferric reductase-like transmembrane domain-containing protein [Anaerolineales bacterium]|nr:ferric reductase-like transmembrane domain-containing protein [Anaerolineales bacterium]
MNKPRFTLLQIAIHLYAWSSIALLLFKFFTNALSANPIQDLERATGRHAIALLFLALACTPLNTLFKWSEPLKRRRTLGLYALLYATIHFIIYINLDYGLAWSLILPDVIQKPRLIVGILALLLMLPLGVTSFDLWKKRLGKNWKRLHKTIYLIAGLAVLHFAWSKKGDLFTLQGEILEPLLYGLLAALLLMIRLPALRRFIASFSTSGLLAKKRNSPTLIQKSALTEDERAP